MAAAAQFLNAAAVFECLLLDMSHSPWKNANEIGLHSRRYFLSNKIKK